jgi:hypothetical protein
MQVARFFAEENQFRLLSFVGNITHVLKTCENKEGAV